MPQKPLLVPSVPTVPSNKGIGVLVHNAQGIKVRERGNARIIGANLLAQLAFSRA